MPIDRRRFLARGAAAVAALAVPGISRGRAQTGGITAAERAEIARLAQRFMAAYDVPGLGVAFALDGRVRHEDAFGLADPVARTPLTSAHRFRIASISKPVTATAIFTLVEAGRLRLGDHVLGADGILGDDYGALPTDSPMRALTVEHLLTHTAGAWPNEGSDPMFRQPSSVDQATLIATTLSNRPLVDPPGGRFAYSNFGYCLLGRVIEKLTRQPYAAYVQTAVLARAGVADMEIAGNTLAERKPLEVRYEARGTDDPYGLNVRRMDSHGGWIARPAAIAQFASGLSGMLQPATIEVMTTPSAANGHYAKGWSISAGGWWHSGHLAGTTGLLVHSHAGLCWSALLNTRHRNDGLNKDLDRLLWAMVGAVERWRA